MRSMGRQAKKHKKVKEVSIAASRYHLIFIIANLIPIIASENVTKSVVKRIYKS